MVHKTLHITNGSNLTKNLKELDIAGDYLTWQEMLCEGPTEINIDTESFINLRKAFLNTFYDIEINEAEYVSEIQKLNHLEAYSEIVLWFEYDLFCHINLIGVISLLLQKRVKQPLYLVCSGRLTGEKNLKGLSELSSGQLLYHYDNKVKLTDEDIDLAESVWKTYCGKDHNLLKAYITQKSSFKYLTNCLKAHLERFPNLKSGLDTLEENILNIIKDNTIKSKNHLLGYALNYQGYYGFSDIQLTRIIDKLSIFYTEDDKKLTLNRKGHEALLHQRNYSLEIGNNIPFGGLNRSDYQFSKQQNKLIKTIINAH
ncbi:DUF1835 domain-containing protein [Flavobacteriaceae bacterium LMO-SS05]